MADILIRKLEDEVVAKWRERAKSSGRSLEAELRKALTDAVTFDWDAVWALSNRIGPSFADTTELIREDRER